MNKLKFISVDILISNNKITETNIALDSIMTISPNEKDGGMTTWVNCGAKAFCVNESYLSFMSRVEPYIWRIPKHTKKVHQLEEGGNENVIE